MKQRLIYFKNFIFIKLVWIKNFIFTKLVWGWSQLVRKFPALAKIPVKYFYIAGVAMGALLLYLGIKLIMQIFIGGPPSFPTPVDVVMAQPEKWQMEINATGSLHAMQGIMIKTEVSGRITHLYFKSGQYVKKGDPLIQFNPNILRAELAANEAKLALSKVEYQREQELFAKKVGTKSALDRAFAELEANQANVDRSKAQLEELLIKAPFSGKMGLRLVELGDYLTAGDPIANLQSIDPLRVDFSVPEIYLNDLKDNQTVIVHSRSYPKQKFIGKVYAHDSVINSENRSLAVRAQIPNLNNQLLPGTFVDIVLVTGQPQQVIFVPQTAIVYDEEGNYVYRVVKNQAVKAIVSLGSQRDDKIAVTEGLTAGDVVIVAGHLKIGDGSPVMDRKQMKMMPQK